MTEGANDLTIGDGARDARGVVPSSSDRARGMLPLSLLALAQAKGAPEGGVRRAVGLAPDAVLGLDDAAPLSPDRRRSRRSAAAFADRAA